MKPRLGWWRSLRTVAYKADAAFEPGQLWVYKTRPGEKDSRLVICRIETDEKLGQIIHIQLVKVKVKNKNAPGGVSQVINHLPYSGEALRASVVRLQTILPQLPPYEEGYQTWRAAFVEGKAGVWTIPVAEAIEGMEKGLNN